MLDGKKVYAILLNYIDETLAGAGALKGASCQIQSITEITGGHRITFAWELNDGTSQTSTLDVMNGAKGEDGATGADGADGVGIASIEKTGTSGLVDTYTIIYTDGDTDTFTVTNGKDGEDGSQVSITQIQTTGTKIAEVDIDGTTTELYAPNGGGGGGSDYSSEIASLSTENSLQTSEISSLSAENSTQTSELTSLSAENSTQSSELGSLSSENSTQATEIGSLTTATSENAGAIGSMSQSMSEIASTAGSLSTENSTQNSQLGSLSTENSTQTSELSSLSAENSTQTSELASLSTAQSEMGSELTVIGSEVADKQDALVEGLGINIDSTTNEISTEMVMFTGTSQAWGNLSTAEKKAYTHASITNDEQTGVVDTVPTQNSNHLITSGAVYNSIYNRAPKGKIEVTPDGIKTYGQLLDDLFSQVDLSLITSHSLYEMEYSNGETDVFHLIKWKTNRLLFEQPRNSNNTLVYEQVLLSNTSGAGNLTISSGGVTPATHTDVVLPANDRIIRIVY